MQGLNKLCPRLGLRQEEWLLPMHDLFLYMDISFIKNSIYFLWLIFIIPLLEAYSPVACVGPPYMSHQSLYLSCCNKRCRGRDPGDAGDPGHLRTGRGGGVRSSSGRMLTTAKTHSASQSLVLISHSFCSFVTCFMS